MWDTVNDQDGTHDGTRRQYDRSMNRKMSIEKIAMQPFVISPKTILGPIVLRTADRIRLVNFYTEVIGLRVLPLEAKTEDVVALGVDEGKPLVVLTEKINATSSPARTTGLYHFAILVPTRLVLARSLARLNDVGYPLQGASDHLVSEALYLADPDGNGIEIYVDRPRDSWQWDDGQVDLATLPLDVNNLLAELEPTSASWTGLPKNTCIGHIHLHVGDLEEAEMFYIHKLGFEQTARYGPSATFISAGGYHHHIGMNTWKGVGAPFPPADAVGMQEFTIYLPDKPAYEALRDHLDEAELSMVETDAGIVLQDPSNLRIVLSMPSQREF